MELLEFIAEKLDINQTIIDAGAFIGNHSLFFAQHCKAKKVHAFEPFPSTFELLKANVAANHLSGIIEPHNCALGGFPNQALMKLGLKNNQGTNQISADGNIKVNMTSVDTFLNSQLEDLALIKIDTEGCAEQVLKGAEKTISRFNPILAIEVMPEPLERFQQILEPIGYKLTATFNGTPTHIFEKS